MKRPCVVLFDLGNVLVQFRPGRFWETLGENDVGRQQRVGAELKAMGKGYEAGTMTTEEFRRALVRIVGRDHAPADIEQAFLTILPAPIEGMDEIVRSTARHAATALVTNTSPLHFEHCLRTVPALRHLQRFYLSYHLKTLKPDQAFYRGVVEGEACDPRKMVFIDDVQENVRGAEHAGMTSILFEGAERLKESLRELGL